MQLCPLLVDRELEGCVLYMHTNTLTTSICDRICKNRSMYNKNNELEVGSSLNFNNKMKLGV